jgi:uncharacterized membrane protein
MFLGVPVATWEPASCDDAGAVDCGTPAAIRAIAAAVMLMLAATGWGVVPGWLNYLEAFVIHAWCEWCIGSALMVLVLFLLAVFDWREVNTSS